MEKIIKQRQFEKQQRKWTRRNERRKTATIVPDSGATSTCIRSADSEFVDILDEESPKTFLNANGTESKAGKKARLPYAMRMPAIDADMVPDLAKNSLLSTSKMADADYATVFTKDEVKIFDTEAAKFHAEGKEVMRGWRCQETGLWRLPLQPLCQNLNTDTALLSEEASKILDRKSDAINSVYELPSTEEVIAWYHAAAGYPTKATWLKAISAGFYATWPLLTVKAVKKYYPEAEETPKGHMRRVKSGIRSTKAQLEEPPEVQLAAATLADLRRKHRDVYVQIKDISELIYTDQTGQFPVTSSRGHKYIMVLVEVDGNYIAMEPMKSREASEMIRAYNLIIARLKSRGIKPSKQMLDNEASQKYLDTIESHGITWELVPPTNHRRLIAERAIQTAKGHIIANLMGCDETFPMREWHRLLPQMELTLNMLRASNVRPNISAHSYVHGIHDYNRMPLAPLGCSTQCFVGPENRTSFGEHSIDSWYIGTSPDHYRCHTVFTKETKMERVTDTISFKHKRITNPMVSAADEISSAAANLTKALKNNMIENLPNLELAQLEKLAEIFETAAKSVSETNARAPRVAETVQEPRVPITAEDLNQNRPNPRVNSQATASDNAPRYRTRSQSRMEGNITTDAMLAVMEMTEAKINPRNLAAKQFPRQFLFELAGAVMDQETGDMMEYRHLLKNPKYREVWSKAFGKEIGRLAQGQKGVVEGTNALFFIKYEDIPLDRKKDITYARICANYRPEKADPNRIRITLGGNLVSYPGDVGPHRQIAT